MNQIGNDMRAYLPGKRKQAQQDSQGGSLEADWGAGTRGQSGKRPRRETRPRRSLHQLMARSLFGINEGLDLGLETGTTKC
jgi:hypothetical protein